MFRRDSVQRFIRQNNQVMGIVEPNSGPKGQALLRIFDFTPSRSNHTTTVFTQCLCSNPTEMAALMSSGNISFTQASRNQSATIIVTGLPAIRKFLDALAATESYFSLADSTHQRYGQILQCNNGPAAHRAR